MVEAERFSTGENARSEGHHRSIKIEGCEQPHAVARGGMYLQLGTVS